jgi:hypothetical protein
VYLRGVVVVCGVVSMSKDGGDGLFVKWEIEEKFRRRISEAAFWHRLA